jgi:hypothetical protein
MLRRVARGHPDRLRRTRLRFGGCPPFRRPHRLRARVAPAIWQRSADATLRLSAKSDRSYMLPACASVLTSQSGYQGRARFGRTSFLRGDASPSSLTDASGMDARNTDNARTCVMASTGHRRSPRIGNAITFTPRRWSRQAGRSFASGSMRHQRRLSLPFRRPCVPAHDLSCPGWVALRALHCAAETFKPVIQTNNPRAV